MPDHDNPPRERMETWGEIANYLRVAVRTVQLWEKDGGLPVHRRGNRVFAYRDELDEWLKQRESTPRNGSVEPIPVAEVPIEPPVSEPKVARARVSWRYRVAVLAIAGVLATFAIIRFLPTREPDSIENASAVTSLSSSPRRLFAKLTSESGTRKTIALPEPFHDMVASPDEKRVYLAVRGTKKMAIVDVDTLRIRTFDAPVTMHAMAVSPDGKSLFVGSFTNGIVQVDADGKKILEQVPTGGAVSDIAVSPDGRRVYLAMMHRGVRRYDLVTREWKQITTQGCPYYCEIDPQGTKLLVSYQCGGPQGRNGRDAIEIFDLASEKSLRIFSGPPLVGEKHRFFPDGDRIWLSGGDACSRDIYDRAGCPLVPGQVHHIFRFSDGQLLHSAGLSWPSGLHPRLFHNGERVLVGEARNLTVLETARFAPLESYRFPTPHVASKAIILANGGKILLTVPESKEMWVLSAEDPSCDDPGPGAVHRFAGDGTEQDSIDNAYIESPPSYKPGFVVQAFEFDGRQRSIIQSKSDFRFGSVNSTLALYAKPFSDETATLLEGGDSTEYWRLSGGAVGIEFTFKPAVAAEWTVRTDKGLPRGKWTHLAVAQTDNRITLFVNGVPVQNADSTAGTFRLTQGFARYALGWKHTGERRYRGLIDEVTFWSRALSPAEIMSLYRRRNEAPCK